jgi:hypothetical protein
MISIANSVATFEQNFDVANAIERTKVTITVKNKKPSSMGYVTANVNISIDGKRIEYLEFGTGGIVIRSNNGYKPLFISRDCPDMVEYFKFIEDSSHEEFNKMVGRDFVQYEDSGFKKNSQPKEKGDRTFDGSIQATVPSFAGIITAEFIDVDAKARKDPYNYFVKSATPLTEDDFRGYVKDIAKANQSVSNAFAKQSNERILKKLYAPGSSMSAPFGIEDAKKNGVLMGAPLTEDTIGADLRSWNITKARLKIGIINFKPIGKCPNPPSVKLTPVRFEVIKNAEDDLESFFNEPESCTENYVEEVLNFD